MNFIETFKNKKILVTGGTGSIGSEIVKQLIKYGPKQIRIFSRDETKQFYLERELSVIKKKKNMLRFLIGDIRDKERLLRAVEGVDIIFHAAAMKHVPFCENNPFEAIKTNIDGTQNLIDCALISKVKKVVVISTDKAVYPNSIMGITKLLMERMVISAWNYIGDAKTKFSVVRFGNIINSRGSVIPLWVDQIKNGQPLTVTDKNMKRYFMTVDQALNLVFTATSVMMGNEIFVLKMKEENIFDVAHKTINKYANGKKVKINFVGIREGEKLKERLFTDEETNYLIDRGPFYIIFPNTKIFNERKNSYRLLKKT